MSKTLIKNLLAEKKNPTKNKRHYFRIKHDMIYMQIMQI